MSVLQDVTILDGTISEVEDKLLEASAEMRTLKAKRRSGGLRILLVSVKPERRCLEPQPRTVKLDKLEVEHKGAQISSERSSFGDRSSVSSAGCPKKKRKAAVRKESADTQEYEACHRDVMDVDIDESKEDWSFVPSAVSDSAGSRVTGSAGRKVSSSTISRRQQWKTTESRAH